MSKTVRFKDDADKPYKPIKKPTKIFNKFWLYEEDHEIAESVNKNPEWKGGKWMMFFDVSRIDKKWKEACKLYREGKVIEHHFYWTSQINSFNFMVNDNFNFVIYRLKSIQCSTHQ